MYRGNAPIIHVYSEINVGEFATVKHYRLHTVINGCQILSELVNVQKDRGFAKSNPDYWLKVRVGKKWETLTGLFEYSKHEIFIADKGNKNKKEELILAKFDDYNEQLIVYYFKNFYTKDISTVMHFVNR